MPRGVYRRTNSRTDGVSLVSAIDWPAMLAQLEHQRAAIDEERADIDAVIETIRRRAGPKVTVAALHGLQRAPARHGHATKKAPASVGGKGQAKISDAQLTSMRTQWERGDAAVAIAKAVKVSDATVYARAKAGKWKRPKKSDSAKVKEPAGTKLPGRVRCTSCDVMTEYDPCEHCGSKLKRKGW